VKIGLAPGDTLLTAANAMRLGTSPEPVTAFDLWQLADRTAGERRGNRQQIRLVLFRHAAIHAGMLKTSRGTVYRRCVMCRESLA